MSDIIQVNPLVFGGEGESVHANMLVKLWENPNPTATFAPQTINLSSDDYDFLLIPARAANGSNRDVSAIITKGESGYLTFPHYSSGTLYNATRLFTYTDDTHIAASDASVGNSTNNAYLIPIAVYGFKKSLDITAIVSNVSTDARKCMLSDGVTSVESVLSGGAVRFQNDSQSYTMPAIGANVDVIKAVTPPSGYSLAGIINATASTGRCAVNSYVYNGQAALEIVNIGSNQAGTSKTAVWTNVFVKN